MGVSFQALCATLEFCCPILLCCTGRARVALSFKHKFIDFFQLTVLLDQKMYRSHVFDFVNFSHFTNLLAFAAAYLKNERQHEADFLHAIYPWFGRPSLTVSGFSLFHNILRLETLESTLVCIQFFLQPNSHMIYVRTYVHRSTCWW